MREGGSPDSFSAWPSPRSRRWAKVDISRGLEREKKIVWQTFGRGERQRIRWAAVGAVLLTAIGVQLAAVTVPASAAGPLFSDSFESGDLSAWSYSRGLAVQSAEVFSGVYAARMTYNGDGTNGGPATFASKEFSPGQSSVYYRLRFRVIAQGPENVNLLRIYKRVSVGLSSTGKLRYRNDLASVTRTSAITVERGVWHTLQVHVLIAGDQGRVETFYDGAPVAALTRTESLGTIPITHFQLGESTRGALHPYDIAFDEVAVDTSFIGNGGPPPDSQPPSSPGGLTATATAPDRIELAWSAASDDVGVVAYEIERDGSRLASIGGAATGYVDSGLAAGGTHTYRVVAVDGAGNRSQPAGPVSATTPGAHLFTDDFESGALSRWFQPTGVTVVESPVRSGRFAARAIAAGSPAYAYGYLSRSATDMRVRLNVQIAGPLSTTAYLLKLRTPTGASIGGLYLTSKGALAFRNDVAGASMTSTTVLAPATWYALELRLAVADGTVEVWLNGAPIAALTGTQPLGSTAVSRLQLGDISSGRTFDLAFDDIVVSCSC